MLQKVYRMILKLLDIFKGVVKNVAMFLEWYEKGCVMFFVSRRCCKKFVIII